MSCSSGGTDPGSSGRDRTPVDGCAHSTLIPTLHTKLAEPLACQLPNKPLLHAAHHHQQRDHTRQQELCRAQQLQCGVHAAGGCQYQLLLACKDVWRRGGWWVAGWGGLLPRALRRRCVVENGGDKSTLVSDFLSTYRCHSSVWLPCRWWWMVGTVCRLAARWRSLVVAGGAMGIVLRLDGLLCHLRGLLQTPRQWCS